MACLKQQSIKQIQEPTRVSSLLETALKHTIQREHGILSTLPTPRSHILEHSVWDTSENKYDQIPLVISSWGQVESFLPLVCSLTLSEALYQTTVSTRAYSDAVTLPSTKCTWFFSTIHLSPDDPSPIYPYLCVLLRLLHTLFIPQRDESVEWLQTAGEAEAGRAELSRSLPDVSYADASCFISVIFNSCFIPSPHLMTYFLVFSYQSILHDNLNCKKVVLMWLKIVQYA